MDLSLAQLALIRWPFLHRSQTRLYLSDFLIDDQAIYLLRLRHLIVFMELNARSWGARLPCFHFDLHVLFGLGLESLELSEHLNSFLQRSFEFTLFTFSEDEIACDAWQQFHDEGISDEVKQLRLDFWSKNHIELSRLTDEPLVCHSHLMLLTPNVLGATTNRSIRLQRLDLSVDGIEPLFKVEVGLGAEDKRPTFVLDLQDVVA